MSNSAHIVLRIGGMHCAGCALAVESALTRQQGISSAAVSLTTEKAFITYDPRFVSPDGLMQVVHKTGYTARLPGDVHAKAHEKRVLWVDRTVLAICLLLVLPLLVVNIHSLALRGVGL